MRNNRVREMGKWMYDKMSDWVSERQSEKLSEKDEGVNERLKN
jgi:hypothetical protein